MIEAAGLTKRYGEKTAVDDVTFTVRPGVVTGFLGPNGAGKSTTMRMIVGLDRPTSGAVLVNGKHYRDNGAPLHEVGALLEAKAVHTSRSAYNHLKVLAATHGISDKRVVDVLELVGLSDVGRKRAGAFSLGMGQRLGIASALLGDPGVLLLDEPINGLDPEGIRWVRDLLRGLAAEGRTVFVSSHLMSEMQQTADHLVIVGRGRLIADADMADVVTHGPITVRCPDPADLATLRDRLAGRPITSVAPDGLTVEGIEAAEIGDLAFTLGIRLHELSTGPASLEDAYHRLTTDSVEFASGAGR